MRLEGFGSIKSLRITALKPETCQIRLSFAAKFGKYNLILTNAP